jgi:hypothetical protein
MTGSGTILLQTYVNGENMLVNGTTDGSILFSWAATGIKAYDYGNADVTTGVSGSTISGGTGSFKCYALEIWRLTQNTNTTCTVSGTINVEVELLRITNSLNTRGGEFIWNSSGYFRCNGKAEIRDSNGVQISRITVGAGSGPMDFFGELEAQALSEFTCAGDADLRFYGDSDIQATAVTDWGTSTIRLEGSASQAIVFASNPHHIVENKQGTAVITYSDAWVATGTHRMQLQAAGSSIYLAGGAYGSDELVVIKTSGIGTARKTINSSDGVTQFSYTVNSAGPVVRNVNFSNMNFLGADQPCDSNSCGDIFNNNTSPPSPGLVFSSFPLPVETYGQYRRSLGLGLSLGGGVAYPSIN